MNTKSITIVRMLQQMATYRKIQSTLHVSPCRISKVKKELRRAGESGIHCYTKAAQNGSGEYQNSSNATGYALKGIQNDSSATNGILSERDPKPNSNSIMEPLMSLKTPEHTENLQLQLDIVRNQYMREAQELQRERLSTEKLAQMNKQKELQVLDEQNKLKKIELDRPKYALVIRILSVLKETNVKTMSLDDFKFLIAEVRAVQAEIKRICMEEGRPCQNHETMKLLNQVVDLMYPILNGEKEMTTTTMLLSHIEMVYIGMRYEEQDCLKMLGLSPGISL